MMRLKALQKRMKLLEKRQNKAEIVYEKVYQKLLDLENEMEVLEIDIEKKKYDRVIKSMGIKMKSSE